MNIFDPAAIVAALGFFVVVGLFVGCIVVDIDREWRSRR